MEPGVQGAASEPEQPEQIGHVQAPVRVFIGHAPEDAAFCAALCGHLTLLMTRRAIVVWHPGMVSAGSDSKFVKRTEMDRAELLLFLISRDFARSTECWDEDLGRALERKKVDGAVVSYIVVRAVDLAGTPLSTLEPLPKGGSPIANPDADGAWADVAARVREIALTLGRDRQRHELYRGEDRSRKLMREVRQIARLRHPEATVTEHDAPNPFGGLILVTRRSGTDDDAEIEPIGVLDPPMSTCLLELFCAEIEAPYRQDNPLLKAHIVHGGAPATWELRKAAKARGILLRTIDEYRDLINFDHYLEWQSARIGADALYQDALYVDQRAEVRIRFDREETQGVLDTLIDILCDPHPRLVLVLGDFGTGKTFLMRQVVRRLSAVKAAPTPVLIEMRDLDKSAGLDGLLAQHFQRSVSGAIRVDAFRYALSRGKAALLFDGFDELAFRITYDRVTEHFQTVLEAAQGIAKVVVTGRTAHFLNDRDAELELARKASRVDGYRLVKLHYFAEDQIRRVLVKRLGSEDAASRRLALFHDVDDLIGLSANPRMLAFILELPGEDLEKARTRTGKITAASLYELLVSRWLRFEHDRARPRGSDAPLTLDQLWNLITELALLLWSRTQKGIDLRDIPSSLYISLQKIDPARLLDPDEVQATAGSRSLLVRSEQGQFSFMHESVLDWLVARSVALQVRADSDAPALMQQPMTDLMADFFIDLAGREAAIRWARSALHAGADVAVANANRVLRRVEANADARGPDLTGQDLRGQDLSRTRHLRHAILVRANLFGVALQGADLSGANLEDACVVEANLKGANLENANLAHANLSGACLVDANLRGANLTGTVLQQANLLRSSVDPVALDEADSWGACPSRPRRAEPSTSPSLPQIGTSLCGMAIHPNGRVLATGNGHGGINLWDLTSGRALRTWTAHLGQVTSLKFSPDGRVLASASEDHTVRLWEPRSGDPLRSLLGHECSVLSVDFSSAGSVLASASEDFTIRLWDLRSGVLLCSLDGHKERVCCVAFSPDGSKLASGSSDRTIGLWDPRVGVLIRSLHGHEHSISSVAFSPDGRILASGSSDTTVRLWDPHSGDLLRSLRGHKYVIRSVAFSPDGSMLASGSSDRTIGLWDPHSGKLIRSLAGHRDSVRNVVFSPDGSTLASVSLDRTVGLWNPRSGNLRIFLGNHKCSVPGVAFSPDGRTLASASNDAAVHLWDARSGVLLHSLSGHTHPILSVSFSPDGNTLASASCDRTVGLWNARSKALLGFLHLHNGGVRSVVFSPDGSMLASASEDRRIGLWDARSGALLRALEGHTHSVLSVSFSPDGTTLASACFDRTIGLWDSGTGKLLRFLQGHTRPVCRVVFSPDGSMLASASEDKTIGLWDYHTGNLLRCLKGHENWGSSVVFSPDGSTIVSASFDRTIRVWEVRSGKLIRSLRGHTNSVRDVAFSPDGGMLASASEDGTVALWRIADGFRLAVLVPAIDGWAAYGHDGRYRFSGEVINSFWHVVGLVTFEAGELEGYEDAFAEQKPVRLRGDEPLW